jgi:hypothetical protein
MKGMDVENNNEGGKCRTCGTEMTQKQSKEKTCVNPECLTNKRTKPICQKCRVIMEEFSEAPAGQTYKCPVCGVVSQP